ncbi:hypothetical protein [Nocardia aurantiaca]|uniref:Secreted protein n=1 Tax=Nocardia aurantiaca TaxID=2675850 RepID=A0A6I3L2S0_9NOCA|nr:hypothetical protein [Nocardia aurantiaca]MTE14905.1 hypothetical protein [Nocardia aurantiaca]
MRWIRPLLALPLAAGALFAAAGTAAADPVTTFTPAYTAGGGAFPCFGQIEAFHDPQNTYLGKQTVWVRADFTFLPIPSGMCSATATLSWRNLDTGASGGFPPVWLGDATPFGTTNALWVPETLPTGPGRVEVTIDTDFLHLPGKGTFYSPE